MKPQVKKVAGVLASATLLSSAGVAMAAPLMDVQADAAPAVAEQAAAREAAGAEAKAVAGTFSYTQETATSTGDIASMFSKAVAQLCSSAPEERIGQATELIPSIIQICNECGLAATLDVTEDNDDAVSRLMACSCASNVPGGGAIANAEVSGTSIEAVAAMAKK